MTIPTCEIKPMNEMLSASMEVLIFVTHNLCLVFFPCYSLRVGLLLIGSPVLLMIFLLHVSLSITSLVLKPVPFQVSLDCIFLYEELRSTVV